MKETTIFSEFLTLLGVRHTQDYSDSRFLNMPFRTLFGMKSLLKEYGVESTGVRLGDKTGIGKLPVPFIAKVGHQFVIVNKVSPTTVSYISAGDEETASRELFLENWDGMAFIAEADSGSMEPKLCKHRMKELMTRLRDIGVWVVPLFLIMWLTISEGYERNVWETLLILLNIAGLALSFLLVQKTLGIRNKATEHVCNVMEKGGCDKIAKSDGATFLGVFHWSEVGLTFFGVSLFTMLLLPGLIPELALLDICALPYTVWSISYQKFKAKAWCTMCVGVQLTLWILFMVFHLGGWTSQILPLSPDIVPLVAVYVTVMLLINKLDAYILKNGKESNT